MNLPRLLLFTLVMTLAAFFRLYQIDAIPPGFFIDEAQDALDAHSIQQGEQFPVFVEAGETVKGRGREPLFHYLMAATFSVFGTSLRSVRLTSALIGLATVAAFFLLCDRLYGPRMAFIAGVLLAVCRWHVTFSRIAMRSITVPLLIVLTVLAFHALARRRTAVAAAGFGATLALGFYTYQAYWAVPPALVVLTVVILRNASALDWGRYLRLALAASAAFAAVIAPLASYVVRKPDYFFARTGETWDPTTQGRETFSVRDNVQRVLFMLHFRGDPQPRHNIPGRPLLDPISGVCFLIGLFVLLKTIGRDPPLHAGILLFWLFPLMPSVFSDAAPHAMRALGAAPAVCLIAAVGLTTVIDGTFRSRVFTVLRGPIVLLLAALSAVVALNYHAFFIEWGRDEAVAADFSGDIPRFFDYAADLAEGNEVYACPYVYFSPNLRFLRIARQVSWKAVEDDTAFVAASGQERDRVYICDSPRVNFLIENLYPQAEVIGRYSVYTAHTGKIYRIKKETLRAALSDDERAEVSYFMAKVLADFRVQMKQW